MICKNCYFVEFCYAADPERIECDSFAKELTEEYKYYLDRLNKLDKLKASATGEALHKILCAIDQLEDFCEYTCQDIASGPRAYTEELPF